MASRVRSTNRKTLWGYWQNNPPPSKENWRSVTVESRNCIDSWKKTLRADGSLPPSDFELDIVERSPFSMTDVYPGNSFWLQNLPMYGDYLPPRTGLYKIRDSNGRNLENKELALELLSKTHPFRSTVSVPVMLFELIEARELVRFAANSFTSFIAGGYLTVNFGWDTLLDDIRSLARIHFHIQKRMMEFDSITKRGGLRRKIGLRSGKVTYSGDKQYFMTELMYSVQGTVLVDASIRFSGSVRWRVKAGYEKHFEELDKFTLAFQKVLDLETPDLATIWEALPLSWLVDYLYNLSDFLQATNNQAIVEPYDICIMRLLKVKSQFRVSKQPPFMSISGNGRFYRTIKARDVVGRPTRPAINLTWLSLRQLTNLAALATLLAQKAR